LAEPVVQTRGPVKVNRLYHEARTERHRRHSLTKADLIAILVDRRGVNKREAADLVDGMFSIMMERMLVREDVRLADLGNFQVRAKAARPGRNHKTGEAVQIAPKRVVTFQPCPIKE
jgi:integration host factor subunit alpha